MQKPLNCYYMSALLFALLAISSALQFQVGLGCVFVVVSAAVTVLSFYKDSGISQYLHTHIIRLFEKI